VIVALDVGNTNVTFGVVAGGEISYTSRAPTPSADRAFELELVIDSAMGHAGVDPGEPHSLVVSSVVPALTQAIHEMASRRGMNVLVADDTTVPLPIRVEDTAGVGDDRLVNALAAARLHGTPAIVIDMGTATTFDVVAADGAFVGGAIAPGVGLGLDSLAGRTAQLPRVVLALPPRAIGRNTVEAIQSGAVLGYVGLVSHLVRAIAAELTLDGGAAPKVILTGGLAAHPWAAAIPGVDAIDPLLTLRGLAILHAEVAQTAAAQA
jgi:type III pantothenate kinase